KPGSPPTRRAISSHTAQASARSIDSVPRQFWLKLSLIPPRLSAPKLDLKPITPQKLAGRRIEPPTCVPSATGTIPAATAAAEPLDEPPGVRAGSSGLRVGPGWAPANSVVTALPTITAPARRSAHAAAESRPPRQPAKTGLPNWVGRS